MIDDVYVKKMALYNRWQNNSIYAAADSLDDNLRREDRGAVFKSIHQTLSHLLWGDQIWMHRFADLPPPLVSSVNESVDMVSDWEVLKERRTSMDAKILDWSNQVENVFLTGELSWYSGSQKRDIVAPTALLITHMFNHQTHHRGQVHAMITAAGAQPEDTDLFLIEI